MKWLLGRKVGMTRLFTSSGAIVGATIISAGPCYVVGEQGDLLEIGYDEVPEKNLNKGVLGKFKRANLPPLRIIRGFKFSPAAYKIGDILTLSIFSENEQVDITGITKGRGFTGAMKRWGFSGGNKTHGATQWHRRVGSIGQRTTPGKIYKGKKMPGHFGNSQVTVKNLSILKILPEQNLIFLNGSVPGARGSLVVVRSKSES